MNKTTIVTVAALALARTAVGGGNQIVFVPDDYPTITAAVIAANQDPDHWTINVRPGRWAFNANIEQSTTITSTDGPESTTVLGPLDIHVVIAGTVVTIQGLTLDSTSASAKPGSVATFEGCVFQSSDLSISGGDSVIDCTFLNHAHDGHGAAIITRGDTTIDGCTFIENSTPGFGGAIYIVNGEPQIRDCTFDSNSAGSGGAIHIDSTESSAHRGGGTSFAVYPRDSDPRYRC